MSARCGETSESLKLSRLWQGIGYVGLPLKNQPCLVMGGPYSLVSAESVINKKAPKRSLHSARYAGGYTQLDMLGGLALSIGFTLA